jgi:hypothetical protein
VRARRLRTRRLSSVSFHAAMQGEEPAAKRARPGGAAASSPSPAVSAEDSEGDEASGDLSEPEEPGGDEPVVARARALIVWNKAPGGAAWLRHQIDSNKGGAGNGFCHGGSQAKGNESEKRDRDAAFRRTMRFTSFYHGGANLASLGKWLKETNDYKADWSVFQASLRKWVMDQS